MRFTRYMLDSEIDSCWKEYLCNKHTKLVYWFNCYIQYSLKSLDLYWMVQQLFETSYNWGMGIIFDNNLEFMESVKKVIHNFLYRNGYWKNVKDWAELRKLLRDKLIDEKEKQKEND